jgi:hypothetical protein
MRAGEFMLSFFFRNLLVIILTVALGGCRLRRQSSITIDSDATFAGHEEHGRIELDRTKGGAGGQLVPAGWLRAPGSPTFELRVENKPVTYFWLSGGRVAARAESASATPPTVEVEPSFDAGAVKLTVRRGGGKPLHTDTFAREGGGTGPSVLSRNAQTTLDVRGSYRATIRDEAEKPVGWMRVRISPYQPSPRIYEAQLPADVDDIVPSAAVLVLRDEIDWIERHAIDVYRGSGAGENLDRSIDLGK